MILVSWHFIASFFNAPAASSFCLYKLKGSKKWVDLIWFEVCVYPSVFSGCLVIYVGFLSTEGSLSFFGSFETFYFLDLSFWGLFYTNMSWIWGSWGTLQAFLGIIGVVCLEFSCNLIAKGFMTVFVGVLGVLCMSALVFVCELN